MADPALNNVVEWTVSELSSALRRTVEDAYGYVRVRGEVSGFKGASPSGHVYFRLKDDKAVLEAVIWKGAFGRMRVRPEEGLDVIVSGKLTTFAGSSKYQIVIDSLEPAGIGALMKLLEDRKKKLAAEGLFDEARKQLLPFLPKVIGVVTSPTGAVIRDILHRLEDRFPRRVLVWPVRVQGDTSAAEVAAAIHGFNAMPEAGPMPRPDLIIVARGGGSLEDLWAFNEEAVARAIAASPVPVVSGVGHEIDTTIADFAADVRAATPSNAAEIVVARRDELARRIAHLAHRARAAVRQRLAAGRAAVHALAARRGLQTIQTRVSNRERRVAELSARLRRILARRHQAARQQLGVLAERLAAVDQRRRLARLRGRLADAGGRLGPAARARHHRAALRFGSLAGRLDTLSPLAVLGRGYAVCFAADGRTVLRDAASARDGDTVHVRLEHGRLACTVTGREAEEAARPARPDGDG